MSRSLKPSREFTDGTDLEPFNGCSEMFPIRELFDGKTPHGPSQAILTARVARDSIFTCTIKIPLIVER